MNKGDRVGAVLKANKDEVVLIGYGVYVGDEITPDDVGGLACGIPNPRVNLDDGGYVFGCECWWGSEEQVKEMIGDRKVTMFDLVKHRKECLEMRKL